MSDTPETEAEHARFAMGGFTMDFCRKLERERDEAVQRRAETILQCELLEKERGEAQDALVYIAHSGLSARHLVDYAKEALRKLT